MIEITRGKSTQVYRISPDDPLQIDWRPNKFGARWTFYLRRDTPNETKAVLLKLESEDGE